MPSSTNPALGAFTIKENLKNQSQTLYEQAMVHINAIKTPAQGWEKDESASIKGEVEVWNKTDDNNDKHQVRIETKYNQSVYIFESADKNQAQRDGRVGTDGRSVVKVFHDNSYDYIKTEDFIERGKSIFNTARFLVMARDKKNNAYSIQDPTERKVFLDWLDAQEKTLEQQIRSDANLTVDEMRSEQKIANFKEKFSIAKMLLQQSLVDIAASLQKLAPEKSNSKSVISDIKDAEKRYIIDQGRPIIIKIGDIKAGDHPDLPSQRMISLQVPLGEQTIPSSYRAGDYDTKLANHVRDGSGHIDANGEIQLDVVVDNHSSYPPIAEGDEMKRRYGAFLAAKEKISQLASDLVNNSDIDPSSTISIPFSAMMMLSPLIGKKANNLLDKHTSEHNQLADTAYALNMLSSMPPPLSIKIKDKNGAERSVNVEVNISFMNAPVNTPGIFLNKIANNQLQKSINDKGFYEFTERMDKHLADLYSELADNNILSPVVMLNEGVKNEAIKQQLAVLYQQLNKILEEYHADPTKKSRQEYKKSYDDIRNKIGELERTQNSLYAKAMADSKKEFKKTNSSMPLPQYVAEIEKRLLAIAAQLKTSPSDKDRLIKLQNYYLQLGRYTKTQQLFYSDDYLKSDKAYQFHINYLLANEAAGQPIEAFCKSAEDRTGWLRTSLLAHTAYNRIYGHDPNLSNKEEKDEYDRHFAFAAHELSASLENTAFNSAARGFQIDKTYLGSVGEKVAKFSKATILTNSYIGVQIGKMMAGLAKKLFSDTDKFLPKNVFQPQIENVNKRKMTFTASDAPITPIVGHADKEESAISRPGATAHPPTLFSTPLGEKTFFSEIAHIENTVSGNYRLNKDNSHQFEAQPIDNSHQSFQIKPHELNTTLDLKEATSAQNTFIAMLHSYKTVYGDHRLPKITTTEAAKKLWEQALKTVYPNLTEDLDRFFNIKKPANITPVTAPLPPSPSLR